MSADYRQQEELEEKEQYFEAAMMKGDEYEIYESYEKEKQVTACANRPERIRQNERRNIDCQGPRRKVCRH